MRIQLYMCGTNKTPLRTGNLPFSDTDPAAATETAEETATAALPDETQDEAESSAPEEDTMEDSQGEGDTASAEGGGRLLAKRIYVGNLPFSGTEETDQATKTEEEEADETSSTDETEEESFEESGSDSADD